MAPQPRRNEQHNRILNALSSSDLALLQPHLEPVPLRFRDRLQSANREVKHAYFPESGLGSVVAIGGGERRQAEVAVVGWEGMTGLPVVLGAGRSPCDIFMQVEGAGQRAGRQAGAMAEALEAVLEEPQRHLGLHQVTRGQEVFLREAFLLRHQVGHSYEEIADITGVSLSAAKMRVARARDLLHDALVPDYGNVTRAGSRSS